VIRGYRADIDREKIGLGVLAFVRLDADRNSGRVTRDLETAIRAIPEVVACHYISGSGTFELQVVSRDLAAFSAFAREVLLNLPNVKDLHTSFSLGEVKSGSALPLSHLPLKSTHTTKTTKTRIGEPAAHVSISTVKSQTGRKCLKCVRFFIPADCQTAGPPLPSAPLDPEHVSSPPRCWPRPMRTVWSRWSARGSRHPVWNWCRSRQRGCRCPRPPTTWPAASAMRPKRSDGHEKTHHEGRGPARGRGPGHGRPGAQ